MFPRSNLEVFSAFFWEGFRTFWCFGAFSSRAAEVSGLVFFFFVSFRGLGGLTGFDVLDERTSLRTPLLKGLVLVLGPQAPSPKPCTLNPKP